MAVETGENESGTGGTDGEEWGDDWEEAGADVGDSGDFDVQVTPDAAADIAPDPLAGLRGANRLQIWRRKPMWCAGFLDSIDLGDDDELDLRALKQNWGGGTYYIRPQANQGQGFRYVPGAVTLVLTGVPCERGLPIDQRTGQAVIDVAAEPAMGHAPQLMPVRRGGGDAQALMGLFDRVTDRLDRIEQRMSQPAAVVAPVDPLKELRKSVSMIGELKTIAGVLFGNVAPPVDDDDDEEEEEEDDASSPKLEDMFMKLLEERQGEEKPAAAAAAPSSGAVPRLIKKTEQTEAPPTKKRAAPAPAPAPAAPATADVLEVEAVTKVVREDPPPAAAPMRAAEPDPWGATVPEELARGPQTTADVVAGLRSLPPEQAMEAVRQVVEGMDPAQVRAQVAAMAEARE